MRNQRELNRMALVNAAGLAEHEDLESFFGSEIVNEDDSEEFEARLDKAQRYAIKRIRSLIPKSKS